MRNSVLSIMLFIFFLGGACSKYDTSQKAILKAKVIEMYSRLPDTGMYALLNQLANSSSSSDISKIGNNENEANLICVQTIKSDTLLHEFFIYILDKAAKKYKENLNIENAAYTNSGIVKLIKKELRLTESDLKKMKIVLMK
jgi:hypothetical protein